MDVQITLFLDQRRKKIGNVFPVKIRVWNKLIRVARLYPTDLNLSEREFSGAWKSQKPRAEFKETRLLLEKMKSKSQNASDELVPFTFEGFERKLYRRSGDGQNIIYHYEQTVEQLTKHGQIGSASSYELSLKSILKFINHITGKTPHTLTFYEITSDWLKEYEKYMVNDAKKSYTTVGIYLRSLRAIFNKAIAENEIKIDVYPFGKRKYQIPASKNVKKALSKDELKLLFNSIPNSPEQQKAKDFWFFSYSCNGMNIKDISLLRFKDIQNGSISFHRAKTLNTSKGSMKQISTHLNTYALSIIEKYGNKNINPDNLIFEIIKTDQTPTEQKRQVQNFTRFINQHIKKLCLKNKLPEVSTYWARHSFATNSIRNGASMEFIQESLGHGDLKTTKNYFAGFENETKKEFANKLMEF
jgi:integrase/recombinase XerD